jgi:hypothetical protein
LSDTQVKNSVTALAGAEVVERALVGEFIVRPD